MEKRVFYWPKSLYVYALLTVAGYGAGGISALKLISFTKSGIFISDWFVFLFALITLILFSFDLMHKLVNPELKYEAGILKFYGKKDIPVKRRGIQIFDKSVKRRSIQVHDIVSITETEKVSGEIGKFIAIPSFLIKTRQGEEYEYDPKIKKKDNKRIEKIKMFLASCPGIPPVKPGDKESLIPPDL